MPFIEALLHAGAEVNDFNPVRKVSSIHLAVKNGLPESLEILLYYGANVNGREGEGRTCSHRTMESRRDGERPLAVLRAARLATLNRCQRSGQHGEHPPGAGRPQEFRVCRPEAAAGGRRNQRACALGDASNALSLREIALYLTLDCHIG